ncbi:hypothetical protein RRF57_000301 [Xylaria bambusicola]|uniref:Uncharacterized protein n=1 Tax=Xylaria bambusicola TaxID=326684 RepID=A0AAN7UFG0_9PEZI
MTVGRERCNGLVAEPGLDDDVFANRDVVVCGNFLPHHRYETSLSYTGVVLVNEFLQKRHDNGRVVSANAGVETVHVKVHLISAGVEISTVWGESWQEILHQRIQEGVNLGLIEANLTTRGLSTV